jgi:mRNA-degrading endonuclease RelE of RelBE toxin-antitoxin system
LTRGSSSAQSTKRTDSIDTAERADQWGVKLHREVAKLIIEYGLENEFFVPSLGELIEQLERDPKVYPKKKGRLKKARAAALAVGRNVWRAVFTIDEKARTVLILAINEHDAAYNEAMRRI